MKIMVIPLSSSATLNWFSRFAEIYIWKWNGYILTNCERIEAIEIFAMKISALFATLSPI